MFRGQKIPSTLCWTGGFSPLPKLNCFASDFYKFLSIDDGLGLGDVHCSHILSPANYFNEQTSLLLILSISTFVVVSMCYCLVYLYICCALCTVSPYIINWVCLLVFAYLVFCGTLCDCCRKCKTLQSTQHTRSGCTFCFSFLRTVVLWLNKYLN